MEQKPLKIKDREYYLFALKIAGDFGATIAVPVVIFVLIGQYLDQKFESGYTFLVLAFILAAIISGRIIYKKAKRYGEEYQNLVNKNLK